MTTLSQLLNDYLDERQQPAGLAAIFRNYEEWLAIQSWYQFSPPAPDRIN
ncbi:hypothetical protein ACFV30_27215 [Streptomyces sp. NPDC059752]